LDGCRIGENFVWEVVWRGQCREHRCVHVIEQVRVDEFEDNVHLEFRGMRRKPERKRVLCVKSKPRRGKKDTPDATRETIDERQRKKI